MPWYRAKAIRLTCVHCVCVLVYPYTSTQIISNRRIERSGGYPLKHHGRIQRRRPEGALRLCARPWLWGPRGRPGLAALLGSTLSSPARRPALVEVQHGRRLLGRHGAAGRSAGGQRGRPLGRRVYTFSSRTRDGTCARVCPPTGSGDSSAARSPSPRRPRSCLSVPSTPLTRTPIAYVFSRDGHSSSSLITVILRCYICRSRVLVYEATLTAEDGAVATILAPLVPSAGHAVVGAPGRSSLPGLFIFGERSSTWLFGSQTLVSRPSRIKLFRSLHRRVSRRDCSGQPRCRSLSTYGLRVDAGVVEIFVENAAANPTTNTSDPSWAPATWPAPPQHLAVQHRSRSHQRHGLAVVFLERPVRRWTSLGTRCSRPGRSPCKYITLMSTNTDTGLSFHLFLMRTSWQQQQTAAARPPPYFAPHNSCHWSIQRSPRCRPLCVPPTQAPSSGAGSQRTMPYGDCASQCPQRRARSTWQHQQG